MAGQYIVHHVSYEDPPQPGSLGKVSALAKVQSISREKAEMHKPRRRRIPTLPPWCLV